MENVSNLEPNLTQSPGNQESGIACKQTAPRLHLRFPDGIITLELSPDGSSPSA